MIIASILILAFVLWILWIVHLPRKQEKGSWGQLSEETCGNKICTYTDFGAMFADLLADIGEARKCIHVQFFKFVPDLVGIELSSAMIDKAKDDIDTRLLYDSLCCQSWHWYYKSLAQQGILVAGYNRVTWPFFQRKSNFRNHRKIVIIDDKIAYIGGMNIAQQYKTGLSWGNWRDTMIRIEGPAAISLHRIFMSDWNLSTRQQPFVISPTTTNLNSAGGCRIHIIASGPHDDGHTILNYLIHALNHCQKYAYFESPYFIPPPELMHALCCAARRGVDIRVLLPPHGDNGEAPQWASRSRFAKAMEAGIRIGIYQSGFMHSKLMVTDDCLAFVTSANIDYRSYFLSQEVAAAIADNEYALALKKIFLQDEAESEYITPNQWRHRPLTNKAKEKLCQLISFQL
ncbi:MAG: cardiolipin synthase [Bacteroidales bacterium]|nr:cardiolipin synthase [Bacteroidales bacterium]